MLVQSTFCKLQQSEEFIDEGTTLLTEDVYPIVKKSIIGCLADATYNPNKVRTKWRVKYDNIRAEDSMYVSVPC